MNIKPKKLLCTILSAAAITTGSFCLTGCKNDDPNREVAICAPKSNATGTNTYEYVLAKDNKTIEYLTFREHISMDYLKRILGTDNPDIQDVVDIYAQYLNDYEHHYKTWQGKNNNVSWIKTNLTSTDKPTATLTITFDFTNEKFEPNEETLKFLSTFMPVNQFYNKRTDKLEYKDGVVDKIYQKQGLDLTCKTTTKNVNQTMHSKLLAKLDSIKESK